MSNNPGQWLVDLLPRKTVYWRGVAPVSNVEKRQIKLDKGSSWYIVGNTEQFNDLGQIRSPVPISDFSLLSEMLHIGELFSDFNLGYIDENLCFSNYAGGIDAIVDFVARNGFPVLADELTKQPQHEIERERKLLEASHQSWLDATDLWSPLEGCSLFDTIVAAKSLHNIWSIWVHIQEKAEKDPTRDPLIEQLNQQLSHAGWTVQVNGSTLFHKPQLTHVIQFNERTKKYTDFYESSNLFCILFDQLYSFIADYDGGSYPKVKECPNCRRSFLPKRNQKYCSLCGPEIASRRNTERNKRWREKHPEEYRLSQERYIENRRNKGKQ